MTPQLWVLLALTALALGSLATTRPRTRTPITLVVLVALLTWALGAV